MYIFLTQGHDTFRNGVISPRRIVLYALGVSFDHLIYLFRIHMSRPLIRVHEVKTTISGIEDVSFYNKFRQNIILLLLLFLGFIKTRY